MDDQIYKEFRELFPTMKVDVFDEKEMKSEEGKKIWRPFLEGFKERMDDFNFLTLVRLDSSKDYSEENTTVGNNLLGNDFLVPRVQFLCIEIARLREGHNKSINRST